MYIWVNYNYNLKKKEKLRICLGGVKIKCSHFMDWTLITDKQIKTYVEKNEHKHTDTQTKYNIKKDCGTTYSKRDFQSTVYNGNCIREFHDDIYSNDGATEKT